jgi:hypothetical protein
MATTTDADRQAIVRISSVVRRGEAFLDDLKSLNNVIDKSQTFAARKQYLKKVQSDVQNLINTLTDIEISMKHYR